MITAAFVLLALAAAGFLVRLVRGPSLADRVVALDGLLVLVVTGLALDAAVSGRSFFIDAAVVLALLGYIGTGVSARLVEHRGA